MANYPFSNQRAVELAKMVMRGHHALGGTAGRSHFEGGGDAAANAVAVDPNIEHASDVNTFCLERIQAQIQTQIKLQHQ